MSKHMFEIERLEQILELLRECQTASVKSLAKRMFVSEATIRRDLNELELHGLVKRVHGGAVLLDGANREVPLYLREQQSVEAKRKIAAEAARFLRDGQVIFLDASSTTRFLIKHFEAFKALTIVTYGLRNAQEMSNLNHKIFCTGGLLIQNSSAYAGDYTIEFVRNFNADIFFFSSQGVSEDGQITDSSCEETCVRRAMIEQSKTHVFLCDQNKRGFTYCYNLCNVSQVHYFISDFNPK